MNLTRIGVLGDSLLDVYYEVEPSEWDAGIEGPAYRIVAARTCLGGAANVAAAVVASGARASLFSVVGQDVGGREIDSLLTDWGIESSSVRHSELHETRVLSRLMGQGASLPVRFDYSGGLPLRREYRLSTESRPASLALPADVLHSQDGMLIADYGGLITPEAAESLLTTCRDADIPVVVDPSRGRLEWYRGCTGVKLNLSEVESICGEKLRTDSTIRAAIERVRTACAASVAIVTLGSKGALAVTEAETVEMPSRAPTGGLRNPTGAGDAFLAGFMVAYCKHRSLSDSMESGLLAASVAVTTACTCPAERHRVRRSA